MPIDFNQPTESQTVAGRNTTSRDAQKALAQLLDPAVAGTLSNVPTGAYRLNAGVLERYNGTSWGTQSINGVTYSGGGPSVSVAWPIAMGGTGATTAAGARTAIGSGATGDALFTATTAAGARATLGLGSAALQNSTSKGNELITAADAAAGRTALGLGSAALQNSTSKGNELITAADAAAVRTAANLATIASSGSASDLSSGTVPTARLGSGTANSTTVLYGNNTWGALPSAGVTSLTAGSGITVSASTGAVTVSQDIYTGTSNTNTVYPIGSYVSCYPAHSAAALTPYSPNTTIALYRGNTSPYSITPGSGGATALSGTWRTRGISSYYYDGSNDSYGYIFQRVA